MVWYRANGIIWLLLFLLQLVITTAIIQTNGAAMIDENDNEIMNNGNDLVINDNGVTVIEGESDNEYDHHINSMDGMDNDMNGNNDASSVAGGPLAILRRSWRDRRRRDRDRNNRDNEPSIDRDSETSIMRPFPPGRDRYWPRGLCGFCWRRGRCWGRCRWCSHCRWWGPWPGDRVVERPPGVPDPIGPVERANEVTAASDGIDDHDTAGNCDGSTGPGCGSHQQGIEDGDSNVGRSDDGDSDAITTATKASSCNMLTGAGCGTVAGACERPDCQASACDPITGVGCGTPSLSSVVATQVAAGVVASNCDCAGCVCTSITNDTPNNHDNNGNDINDHEGTGQGINESHDYTHMHGTNTEVVHSRNGGDIAKGEISTERVRPDDDAHRLIASLPTDEQRDSSSTTPLPLPSTVAQYSDLMMPSLVLLPHHYTTRSSVANGDATPPVSPSPSPPSVPTITADEKKQRDEQCRVCQSNHTITATKYLDWLLPAGIVMYPESTRDLPTIAKQLKDVITSNASITTTTATFAEWNQRLCSPCKSLMKLDCIAICYTCNTLCVGGSVPTIPYTLPSDTPPDGEVTFPPDVGQLIGADTTSAGVEGTDDVGRSSKCAICTNKDICRLERCTACASCATLVVTSSSSDDAGDARPSSSSSQPLPPSVIKDPRCRACRSNYTIAAGAYLDYMLPAGIELSTKSNRNATMIAQQMKSMIMNDAKTPSHATFRHWNQYVCSACNTVEQLDCFNVCTLCDKECQGIFMLPISMPSDRPPDGSVSLPKTGVDNLIPAGVDKIFDADTAGTTAGSGASQDEIDGPHHGDTSITERQCALCRRYNACHHERCMSCASCAVKGSSTSDTLRDDGVITGNGGVIDGNDGQSSASRRLHQAATPAGHLIPTDTPNAEHATDSSPIITATNVPIAGGRDRDINDDGRKEVKEPTERRSNTGLIDGNGGIDEALLASDDNGDQPNPLLLLTTPSDEERSRVRRLAQSLRDRLAARASHEADIIARHARHGVCRVCKLQDEKKCDGKCASCRHCMTTITPPTNDDATTITSSSTSPSVTHHGTHGAIVEAGDTTPPQDVIIPNEAPMLMSQSDPSFLAQQQHFGTMITNDDVDGTPGSDDDVTSPTPTSPTRSSRRSRRRTRRRCRACAHRNQCADRCASCDHCVKAPTPPALPSNPTSVPVDDPTKPTIVVSSNPPPSQPSSPPQTPPESPSVPSPPLSPPPPPPMVARRPPSYEVIIPSDEPKHVVEPSRRNSVIQRSDGGINTDEEEGSSNDDDVASADESDDHATESEGEPSSAVKPSRADDEHYQPKPTSHDTTDTTKPSDTNTSRRRRGKGRSARRRLCRRCKAQKSCIGQCASCNICTNKQHTDTSSQHQQRPHRD